MIPLTRRSCVCTLGAVPIGGIAGCLGAYGSADDRESASPTVDSTDTPRPRTFTPAGPDRAQGEPVSVERTITDEPGYEDGIEYYPSNRTVRLVAARSGDEPISYGTWSFDEWGRIETAEVGLERARKATAERLGTSEFGSGMGTPPADAPMVDMVIWLHLSVNKDREVYVWAAVDVDTFEVIRVEVSPSWSDLDALLFHKQLLKRSRDQPVIVIDRGKWYTWALDDLDPRQSRRETWGGVVTSRGLVRQVQ